MYHGRAQAGRSTISATATIKSSPGASRCASAPTRRTTVVVLVLPLPRLGHAAAPHRRRARDGRTTDVRGANLTVHRAAGRPRERTVMTKVSTNAPSSALAPPPSSVSYTHLRAHETRH